MVRRSSSSVEPVAASARSSAAAPTRRSADSRQRPRLDRRPLNLLGDYGGGSLYLVSGILAALFERAQSGRGQVVDAAIVDGASRL